MSTKRTNIIRLRMLGKQNLLCNILFLNHYYTKLKQLVFKYLISRFVWHMPDVFMIHEKGKQYQGKLLKVSKTWKKKHDGTFFSNFSPQRHFKYTLECAFGQCKQSVCDTQAIRFRIARTVFRFDNVKKNSTSLTGLYLNAIQMKHILLRSNKGCNLETKGNKPKIFMSLFWCYKTYL